MRVESTAGLRARRTGLACRCNDGTALRLSQATVDAFRERFQPRLSRWQCARFVDDMVNRAIDHWTTTCYDQYQRCWLGIV